MKRKSLLFLLLLAFMAPWTANAQTTVFIGDPESPSEEYKVPFNMYWGYSLVQQIFIADEIGMAGTITSIAFDFATTQTCTMDSVQVYLKNVDKTSFHDSGMEPIDDDAVLVFNGNLPIAPGWVVVEFDTPFFYDGTSNLLLCCYDPNSVYYGKPYKFRTTSTSGELARSYHSDYYCPNLNNLYSFDGFEATYSFRSNIQLEMVPGNCTSCAKPTNLNVTLTPGDGTVAELAWTENGSATQWQICLNNDVSNLITVSQNSFTLTGLTPETVYTAKVRACCDETDHSVWSSTVNFTPSNITYLTVNDGTATNTYVPIYGYWADKYSKCQFIIPAADLAEMQWGIINKLTFYSSNTDLDWGAAEFEIYMTEVDYTTFSANTFINWSSMEKVKNAGTLSINGNVMEITLDAPYQYMGGNLLIGVKESTSGTYGNCSWYGVSQAGNTAIGGYEGSKAISLQSFLPKTTFGYFPGEETTCFKPTNFVASDVTGHTVTLSWQSDGEAWQIGYRKEGETEQYVTVTENPYTLTGLDPETNYEVRVQTKCGEELYSIFTNAISFTTDVACPAPTDFTVTENSITAYGATTTWTGTTESYVVMIGEPEIGMVTEGFEDQVIPAYFTNDVSYPWKIEPSGYNGSSYCIIPGNKGVNSSSSYLTVEVTGPCTISFMAKISSENGYDYGYFLIDNTQKLQISGTQDWTEYSYELTEGTHTLVWRYQKDYSSASGSDLFYVDDITMPIPSVNSWTEYTTTEQSYTFGNLAPETAYQVKVKGNCGDDGYSEETAPVSFTTDQTHYWNEGNTWPGGEVPADYIDVEITTNVIIAADSTVYAGNVTIENGGSLTMEPGARFYHSNEVPVNVQMNVEGYDTNAKDGDGGYKLIASPIDPSVFVPSTHLVDNYDDYDLYLFDQSGDGEGNQWLNYKQGEFDSLYITKGYLYANTENVLAVFAGPTKPTNEDVTVNLDYDADAPYELAGWNLIGNPFTCIAYIDHDMYIMNPDGDEIISVTERSVEAMQGIFVVAEGEDETVTFSTTAPAKSANLVLNVSNGRNFSDRAIVRFGESNQLPKIQLNPNHTKVYFTKNDKDYAVVRSEEVGELPVSFKAESNGTYNLSFAAEEVSFNYLHLIDNMTGKDVDLLETPSYTFNAQTTDYASRFKLVFATGNNSNDDSFAFYSNGNFVINNDGEATLQVVDVMGRILSSQTIIGSASINVNAATGVYMLRLINGNDVKVQKVVVR